MFPHKGGAPPSMHVQPARSLLSPQNGMNLYRGCTHGCIYCDSRSTCYRMAHAFEDVGVKAGAPALLERELRRRAPCMISTGSMSDPYLPLERETELMRRCLALIDRYGFGVTVLTKSDLVLRDLDLLQSIGKKAKSVVQMTLTTYDEALVRRIEPHVCTTKRRFEVLCACRDCGIPTVVWLCPVLPFINDTEENLRGILSYCFEAGVRGILCFGFGVTLREGSREPFFAALDREFPGLRARYLRRYGLSYECRSDHHAALMRILRDECRAHGVLFREEEIFSYLREFPAVSEQLRMF